MLPDFTSPVEFQDRVDSLLVLMARSCPELAVLVSCVNLVCARVLFLCTLRGIINIAISGKCKIYTFWLFCVDTKVNIMLK